MADDDLRDQIARIEADIEQLAECLDRCRKAMPFAKLAIAAGGLLILAYFVGAIWFESSTMIGAIAAMPGRPRMSSNGSCLDRNQRRGPCGRRPLAAGAIEYLLIPSASSHDRDRRDCLWPFRATENGVKTLTHNRGRVFHAPNMLRARPTFSDLSSACFFQQSQRIGVLGRAKSVHRSSV
jgi:hypothetical protein